MPLVEGNAVEDKEQTISEVAHNIMRQERGVIGLAQHNSVMFEPEALGLGPIVIGLDFCCLPYDLNNRDFVGYHLDKAARTLIKSFHE